MEGYEGGGSPVEDDAPAELVALRGQRAALEAVARKKSRDKLHKEEAERLRKEIRELGYAPVN